MEQRLWKQLEGIVLQCLVAGTAFKANREPIGALEFGGLSKSGEVDLEVTGGWRCQTDDLGSDSKVTGGRDARGDSGEVELNTSEVEIGHQRDKSSNYLGTGSGDTTVLLWRIHRASTSRLSSASELSTGSGSSTSANSNSTIINSLADKSRRRRIEGPVHALRGHLGEIICCCVSSDLGIVVSSSNSSDVLLHSIRKGRLIRRMVGVEAHAVCLSSDGIIMAWNKSLHTLSTFTLNGTPTVKAQLPFSCSISCMESAKSASGDDNAESYEMNEDNRLEIPSPSIYFLDLHTLKVFHTLKLGEGQDITALALDKDNTNLLVSTADRQLTIFTDPTVSSTFSMLKFLVSSLL
ncbi:WD-40 repeat family protein [Actinidia rufa]|uniref:WD-40 repeat family protein n=1 Tax=Actinidia rufa TaxID=165716 RepID=A0A7J0F161_9ERIC|nr:WD-40 repeat family protein [Actinidia rufa]